MDNILFSRRRAERFAQLLDEANGGRRHHVRSRADGQLAPLVAVGQRLSVDPPAVEVNPDFRTGLRAMLLATAEREGLGTPAAVEPAATRPAAATRGSLLPAVTARRARARGAILIGIAAGAIAVSGISAASENAVPGDALYGMKRSTERAQLALASSDISRGQLFLDFARTRLGEAAELRGDRIGYSAVLDDMDADTRQGVRLLTAAAVQRAEPASLDTVNTFVTGQRRAVGNLVDGATRADRERTRRSLELLDSVRERSDGLRAAIGCGLPAPTGSDALGPVPTACPGTR
ncbi:MULTISPECIES: DUF5667 domain-containing protein [unclassified Micromonospora]|uniref:DUF5667 domain-containing protein n=1 Tax=unclassified Micromonospora TaxID=2617518 RepID=UPI002E23B5E6|nr:DUF5667 domain-containing protein [Micromonospora sp. NBC_00858]